MRKPLSTSITRPADTTAYAAGDVIGTASSHVMTFANALEAAAADVRRGLIVKARVISNEAPAMLPTLELWLFDTAPAAQADNAALAVTDAEMLNLIGVIPLTNQYVGYASNNHVQASDTVAVQFQVKPDKTDIYGVLVVRNAYTPVASEVYKVVLDVV